MDNIDWLQKHGTKAQGKREYLEYLTTGKQLSPAKAIKAACYQCMNSYLDGRNDCEISKCPLYPYMPYRNDKEVKPKKVLSKRQEEAVQKLVSLRSGTRRIASREL